MEKRFINNFIKLWALAITIISLPYLFSYGFEPPLIMLVTISLVAYMMSIGE